MEKETAQTRKQLSDVGSRMALQARLIDENTHTVQEYETALKKLEHGADEWPIADESGNPVDRIKDAAAEAKRVVRGYSTLQAQLNLAGREVTASMEKRSQVDMDVQMIQTSRQSIGEIEQQIQGRQSALQKAQKQHDENLAERRRLFADKDADKEEAAAGAAAEKAQQQKEACRENREKALRALERNKADIARTQKAAEEGQARLTAVYSDAVKHAAAVCSTPYPGGDGMAALFDEVCTAQKRLGSDPKQGGKEMGTAADKLSLLLTKETERKGAVQQRLTTNAQNRQTLKELHRKKKHRSGYAKNGTG